MDESVLRNLDTQHRRLDEAEAELAALLAGDRTAKRARDETPPICRAETYDELTVRNDELRAQNLWAEVDLDTALGPEQRERFETWRSHQRLPWSPSDLAIVGVAGLIGVAATIYDTSIDKRIRDRLLQLKDTPAFREFEKAGQNLAIDYTGPGFGGPAHRVRSAGHDLLRPLSALRQIQNGRFEGIEWVDGVRRVVTVTHGRPVESLPEALVLWAKHLAADFVTKTSLPLPGWTLLYELPWRDARKFAHDVYSGTSWGDGWNSRNGLLTPSLPVISTEVLIRTHVHARAWNQTGSPILDAGHRALLEELLLAAHGLVGAAALGKAVALAMSGPGGALALRHLNMPSLIRTGTLGLQALGTRTERRALAAPSWDALLSGLREPWELREAQEIEAAASATCKA